MTEAYRKRQEATGARGRVGESDMCRLYPVLNGIHSSAEADVLTTQRLDEGTIPADEDPADLGLPVGTAIIRGTMEF